MQEPDSTDLSGLGSYDSPLSGVSSVGDFSLHGLATCHWEMGRGRSDWLAGVK